MKERYDRKATRSEIEKGDWVFLENKTQKHTLSPIFVGPWTVKERRGVNVHLMNNENGINKRVHLNRSKKAPQFSGEGEWDSYSQSKNGKQVVEGDMISDESRRSDISPTKDTSDTELTPGYFRRLKHDSRGFSRC